MASGLNYVEEIEKCLRDISIIVKKKGREIYSDYSITPPQFEALLILWEYGNMTIGELSNKMFLAYSTMTDLIDRMEKNNLVKRVRDDRDRRVVHVHLLQEGIAVIEEVLQKRQNYLKSVLRNFSKEEIIQLKNSLKKLQQEMIE